MKFTVKSSVRKILILGAGASADYGLPTWKSLTNLIKHELDNDKENAIQHKKDILTWLNDVGEQKKYKTIDECIQNESYSSAYPHGMDIENEVFHIMKMVFINSYKENEGGWLKILNEKILQKPEASIENTIAFINYNYDNVLERNFLNFSYLHPKYQNYKYRGRLGSLINTKVDCLFPHGSLFKDEPSDHIRRNIETMKSHDNNRLDAISCYENESHSVMISTSSVVSLDLYILGLGGGLEINLNNIEFDDKVVRVHVTVAKDFDKDRVVEFLAKKYKLPEERITTYDSCIDLINKCF